MSSRLSRIILPKRKDDGTGEVFGVNEELIGGDLSGSSGYEDPCLPLVERPRRQEKEGGHAQGAEQRQSECTDV